MTIRFYEPSYVFPADNAEFRRLGFKTPIQKKPENLKSIKNLRYQRN